MNIFSDLRTARFWRRFLVQSLACLGVASGLIQLIIIFSPDTQKSFFQGAFPFSIVVLICLSIGLFTSWPRPIQMECDQPKTRIKIIKGDILNQDGHLAIGICDTFDTETPNIISPTSLLGQTIERLFGGDKHEIDKLLKQALKGRESIGKIQKPGKTERYPMGTVAVVRHEPRLIFFFSYCQMNDQNVAGASIDSVWKSLNALWEALSIRGNHGPISVPPIGGGLARISHLLPAQDAIRLIALSFMFASRNSKVSDELRIVVLPDVYDRLDRLELQSFLSSLRPS